MGTGSGVETDLEVAGAGEVLPVLVERDGHHAVGGVEGLLHAVSVVNVNVDVHHAPVIPVVRKCWS